MERTFPIVRRYLKVIYGRVQAWLNPIPRPVSDALIAAGLKSAASPNIPSPTMTTPQPSSNPSVAQPDLNLEAPLSPEVSTQGDLDSSTTTTLSSSDPELKSGNTIATPGQQFYWTPFPDHSEGIPLGLPSDTVRAMDILNVLDSGIDPKWAQLNRDGFTVGAGDADFLWTIGWEQNI